MENDKRCGTEEISIQLDELLNESQRKALPGIEYAGWKLCFFRKRLFLEPEIVVRNLNDSRLGIFEYDGTIRIESSIKIRVDDDLAQPDKPDKALAWTY